MSSLWKCTTCGSHCESWEFRCIRCAIAEEIPTDYELLIASPSLLYRVVRGVALAGVSLLISAAMFLFTIVMEYVVLAHVPVSGPWAVLRIALFLPGAVGTMATLAGAWMFISQIWSDQQTISVTTRSVKVTTLVRIPATEDDPSKTNLIQGELELKTIRQIRVVRGWFARRLGYGNIELFADDLSKPAAVIPGIVRPDAFKKKLEIIIASDSGAWPLPHPSNRDSARVTTRRGRTRLLGAALSTGCCVGISVLLWLGHWYRATIDDWDDCIRTNKCFVCHRPAEAVDWSELGKNVRLCPEHSQAWRWFVWGVPAHMLIYEDAPMGGKLFTRFMRWVFAGFWAIGLALAAVGLLLGAVCAIAPGAKVSLLAAHYLMPDWGRDRIA